MANRCYLMGWNAARNTARKPQLESENHVPLYWIAMFDPDDIHDTTVEGATKDKAPRDGVYLACEGPKAIERLQDRLTQLIAATEHDALAAKFVKFAKGFADRGILLQLTEIAALQEPGVYVARLREQLRALANGSAKGPQILELGGLEGEWAESEHAEAMLCGIGTKLTLQERGDETARKQSASAERHRKAGLSAWQTAIDGAGDAARKPYGASAHFDVADVIDHPKFGVGLVAAERDNKIEVQFADGIRTLIHTAS